ncbi:hypothetical protein [Acetomicrobium sp.]|jgi:hypothetical protein|nr:hypothetical protein [Acetomicrobium sp.]MDI9377540.1 hypothetical protein [Synergistota bacterium]MDR9770547.1 hypothetical protein [Acetomicrobium sp.]NLI42701.1 hypothetical protein [Synergistaceae bacterium]HXK99280.1 hypothetical protein [Acetomicrobium sp.]
MIMLIYRGIALFISLVVVHCMFQEEEFWKQASATMVIIPLVMRVLLIK